jgi:hypothetical protein
MSSASWLRQSFATFDQWMFDDGRWERWSRAVSMGDRSDGRSAGRQLIILSHFDSLYIWQSRADVFSRRFGEDLLGCFFDPLTSADGTLRLFLQHEAMPLHC